MQFNSLFNKRIVNTSVYIQYTNTVINLCNGGPVQIMKKIQPLKIAGPQTLGGFKSTTAWAPSIKTCYIIGNTVYQLFPLHTVCLYQ